MKIPLSWKPKIILRQIRLLKFMRFIQISKKGNSKTYWLPNDHDYFRIILITNSYIPVVSFIVNPASLIRALPVENYVQKDRECSISSTDWIQFYHVGYQSY